MLFPQQALPRSGVAVRVDEPAQLWVVVSALEVVQSRFGWLLLCTRRGKPLRDFVFRIATYRKRECSYYVLASIAVGLPRLLSGLFLKPLRAWDYPNKLPFVPKRRCLLV